MDPTRSERTVTNDSQDPLTVFLEPWGESVILQPGATILVVATSDQPGSLEIDETDGELVVCGWPGSRLSVLADGEVICACEVSVPDTPAGMTVRQFMNLTGTSKLRTR